MKPEHTTAIAQVTKARDDDMIGVPLPSMDASFYGYLQHGSGTGGPFRTERVPVKPECADARWLAYFEGRWRRVHITPRRMYIVWRAERITIQIDGV